jgi:hypothetical protein
MIAHGVKEVDHLPDPDLQIGVLLALLQDDAKNQASYLTKRVFDTPKSGKAREIAISDGTSELFTEWRHVAKDPSRDGLVFPSEVLVAPLTADNLWRRTMQPKLEEAGLGWATFQVLRKTSL